MDTQEIARHIGPFFHNDVSIEAILMNTCLGFESPSSCDKQGPGIGSEPSGYRGTSRISKRDLYAGNYP